MPRTDDVFDQKGLIRESYRIEGITLAECKSIFLDWAISVPPEVESPEWVALLLEKYGTAHPDHPMTSVLRDAQNAPNRSGRRGGARGRRSG